MMWVLDQLPLPSNFSKLPAGQESTSSAAQRLGRAWQDLAMVGKVLARTVRGVHILQVRDRRLHFALLPLVLAKLGL